MSGSLARASTGKRFVAASKYGLATCRRSASSTANRRAEINTANSLHLDQSQPPPAPIKPLAEPNLKVTRYTSQKTGSRPKQQGSSNQKAKLATRHSVVPGEHKHADRSLTTQDPLQHILDHPSASIVLRDACKCHKCKDPSTSQREFNIAQIPPDLRPSEVTQDAQGNWTIRWENDMPGWEDHISVFTPYQLGRLRAYMKGEHLIQTKLWDKQTFGKEKFSITYDKYMNSDVDLAEALYFFTRHGLVFIKDVPEEEASVKRIAQRIASIKSTFYGETWDVRSVPDAKNVAYTSKYLGFHSDLLYTKEPPTVQYLHCLHNSATGGESRFVDQFRALDRLRSEDNSLANALAKISLRYEYENDGFYYSDIKPIVQLRATSYQFPKRSMIGHHNRPTPNIYRMFWSPPFLGSILGVDNASSNWMAESLAAMKRYAEILEHEDLVYEEKMEPGTCVMFDNLRVLHARNSFDMNSGNRWLRGAYLSGEDLWSKEMQLKQHMAKFKGR